MVALVLPLAKPASEPIMVTQLAAVQSVASVVVEAEPAVIEPVAAGPKPVILEGEPAIVEPGTVDATPAGPPAIIVEAAPAPAESPAVSLAPAEPVTADLPVLPITALVAAEGVEPEQPKAGVPPAPLGRSMGSMWTLQVGAFGRFGAAHAAVSDAAHAVPDLLAKAEIHIEEALKGSATIYRAQFVRLSEQTAKAACEGLKAKEMACIVLSPRLAVAEAAQ
jgi:hypothetical protein